MQYMLAIYGDENRASDASPEDMQALLEPWFAYDKAVRDAGVFVAGEALQPTPTATTVRVRDGERTFTDGPFAETKEQLGGFYVLECKDLDEALEWAARCPGAVEGSIEVRATMVFEPQPGAEQAAGASA